MKKSSAFLILPSMLLAAFALFATAGDEKASLADQIEATKAGFRSKAPQETLDAFAEGIQSVADSGILEKAITVGKKAPDFTLTNATGDEVSLSGLLEKGPVVLTWYRGGWCPYCNLTLAAYQHALPEIKAAGAQLVALTPELPDKSLTTTEKNELEFEILSDIDQKVAREYGLVFKLTPEVAEIYRGFFDMKEYNGPDAPDDELPLAAAYVIAPDGTVTWAFLDADYTKRAEPADIVKAVESLKQ